MQESGLKAWCFVEDRLALWDYCEVPTCSVEDASNNSSSTGSVATSTRAPSDSPIKETTMQPTTPPTAQLTTQPTMQPTESAPEPTQSPTARPSLPKACETSDPKFCGCDEVYRADYRGSINVTSDGDQCQEWSSQYPQSHDFSPDAYPNSGLESNYCRNPNDATSPWCYTTNPYRRWGYCEVPSCNESEAEKNPKQGGIETKVKFVAFGDSKWASSFNFDFYSSH